MHSCDMCIGGGSRRPPVAGSGQANFTILGTIHLLVETVTPARSLVVVSILCQVEHQNCMSGMEKIADPERGACSHPCRSPH